MKRLITTLFVAASVTAFAEIYDEAVELFDGNDIEASRELFEQAYNEGNKEAALYLGRIAFLDYDFPGAAQWYATYKKEVAVHADSPVSDYERELNSAKRMLERVQKIVLLDSITVDKGELLGAYRLPKSAGRLLTPEAVSEITGYDLGPSGYGHSNEMGETMIWSAADSTGNQRIVESIRLIDGSWSEPMWASTVLNDSAVGEEGEEPAEYNAICPFLLDDGLTLYYASDNEESIGGLDLFLATRNSSTGDYLKPSNMGMPFNSPADDYMLAIDELNGIGWWATDRNHIPGKATVYVYMLPQGRENISEEEDAVNEARIADFQSHWTEENDGRINELIAVIDEIDPDPFREPDFILPIPGGSHYRFWNDFKNPKAAEAMQTYLATAEELKAKEKELVNLRRTYHDGKKDGQTVNRIRGLESQTEKLRETERKQLSDIYRLEFSKNR